METDEKKLLEILGLPDLPELPPEEGELDEEQRAFLSRLLTSQMQSPEEIARDAENAEHNAEIQKKRDEKIARRRERQAKRGR